MRALAAVCNAILAVPLHGTLNELASKQKEQQPCQPVVHKKIWATDAPCWHVNHGRRAMRVQVRWEQFLIVDKVSHTQRGAHDEQFERRDALCSRHARLLRRCGLCGQCAALRHDAREQANEQICVQAPLMRFI